MLKFHLNDAGKKLGLLAIELGCMAPSGAIPGTGPTAAPEAAPGIPMKMGMLPSMAFGAGPGDGTVPIKPPIIGIEGELIGLD